MTTPAHDGVAHLTTLGALDLSGPPEARDQLLAQPKRLALLIYLAHARPRGLRRRDEILARFWPDMSEESARNALSQALHVVRRTLGDSVLESRGIHEVGLTPGRVVSDAVLFEEAVARGDLELAVTTYRGPFLPAFHVSQAPGFEEWLEEERARLQRLCLGALEELAATAEQKSDWDQTVRWRRRFAELEPLDARNSSRLVLALAATGDRTGALRTAEVTGRRLKEEYGTEADPELAAAAVAVRAMPSGLRQEVPSMAMALTAAGQSPPTPRTRPVWKATVAVALLATAIGVSVRLAARPTPPTRRLVEYRVLVAAFESRLTDPALAGLGEVVADRIADGLLRSGVAEVVDPVTALYALRDVRAEDTLATSDSTRVGALASTGAAATVITGTIEAVGDSIVFHARVSDVVGAKLIAMVRVASPATRAATAGVEEVRDQVGGAVAKFLDRDFASLGSDALPPPRLEAYRSFILGLEPFQRSEYPEALVHFLKAASLDTTFVLPVVWANYAADNAGNWTLGDSVEKVATRRLRDRGAVLNALERYSLMRVSSMADSNLALQQDAIRNAAALAPGSSFSFELGVILDAEYRVSEAIASYEQVDLTRGWARGWHGVGNGLMAAYHVAGNHERELQLSAIERWGDKWLNGWAEGKFRALVALGRIDEARGLIDGFFNEGPGPGAESLGWWVAELWQHGYPEEARRLFRRAMDWAPPTSGPAERARLRGFEAYMAREWPAADSLYRMALPSLNGLADDDHVDRARGRDREISLWLRTVEELAITAQFMGDTARADSLEQVWMAWDDGGLRTPAIKRLGHAMLEAARGEADSAVVHLRQVAATGALIGLGSYWFTHAPAWDPIRRSRPYRDFVNHR